MTWDQLLDYAKKNIDVGSACDVFDADCDNIVFLLKNCEIDIPEEKRFFVNVNCEKIAEQIWKERNKVYRKELESNGLADGYDALAFTGDSDFSHTSTEWESVINLGIAGLRKRIDRYAERQDLDAKQKRFYQQLIRVYDAALGFLQRASDKAFACGKKEMAEGLLNLTQRKPSNLYEAMQTTIIYFVFQQIFEGTILRTLGRLDQLFYPFFEKENEEKGRELLLDYIREIDTLKAISNIPFAIGAPEVNELSYLLLETYQIAETTNTKLHILCMDNTPTDIIEKAFEGIRSGNNSIVFLSDKKIVEALKKLGEDHEDAVNYHVVGCYECGGNGELTCSCSTRVNLPKALELALNQGKDMLTGKQIGLECDSVFENYDALYSEFIRQMIHLCNSGIKATDLYEANYKYIHSAPFFSGTYTSALEKGGDLYCDYTAKYNNSSLNAVGIATVVDSLVAINKLVFEEQMFTMEQLVEILRTNWEGNEPLRFLIRNRFPKYGLGNKKIDVIARRIVDTLAKAVNGKPNAKGGVYRLGLFSIDWRWKFGQKTAASADGRLSGETLSQNTSANFGADREGATAHLLSVTSIDASNTPNGTIVDIDLHSSAVQGENGLKTLVATLRTYFELGGFAVHYNVLNTEVLKEARLNPQKYPNLQVRLCGWNVLFSSLSDREKDEFIARSVKS